MSTTPSISNLPHPVSSASATGTRSSPLPTGTNDRQDRDAAPHLPDHADGPPMRRTSRRDLRTENDTDWVAATVISAICQQIKEEDRLLPDGSNYLLWADFVNERMRDAVNIVDFYRGETTNAFHERIGRSILLQSVERSLRRSLARLTSSFTMYTDLSIRFNSISRAAQLDLYRRLIHFNAADHASTTAMTAYIGNIFDEMTAIRMPFTRDHWAGLALQNGLSGDEPLQEEFDRRVEIDLQESTVDNPPMTFNEMIRLLEQIKRQNRIRSSRVNPTGTVPHLLTTATANQASTPSRAPQLLQMALRKELQEEDASQLKLGQEFEMAGCLSISEVKLLLGCLYKPPDTAVYKKTHEYVNQFARFNSMESAQAARQLLSSKDAGLEQFELAQLASLCPEEAEEAKSLIPSIAGKDDDALQALLNGISGLTRYQG